ncbi:MAG: hypothetical protein IKC58_01080, partial [Clostridia bacterium]|nr:hypothetical protein [Clostridia bacterium]
NHSKWCFGNIARVCYKVHWLIDGLGQSAWHLLTPKELSGCSFCSSDYKQNCIGFAPLHTFVA